MKRLFVAGILFFTLLITALKFTAHASSPQAYQDYLYQFDIYRQKYNDFKVAQNEYFKFQTLTSQQTALAAARDMMTQRDILLKTYLLLLNEKLNESPGLSVLDRNYFQTLIRNENAFLVNHSALVQSTGSLNDAATVGRQLEDHYRVLQASMLQIVSGISLGNLNAYANDYDKNLADAKALVNVNRGIFSSEKQSLLDRWLLQINNNRSLFKGKTDDLNKKIDQLKASNSSFSSIDPSGLYDDIKKGLNEGKQYLTDGTAFMGELLREVKFQN